MARRACQGIGRSEGPCHPAALGFLRRGWAEGRQLTSPRLLNEVVSCVFFLGFGWTSLLEKLRHGVLCCPPIIVSGEPLPLSMSPIQGLCGNMSPHRVAHLLLRADLKGRARCAKASESEKQQRGGCPLSLRGSPSDRPWPLCDLQSGVRKLFIQTCTHASSWRGKGFQSSGPPLCCPFAGETEGQRGAAHTFESW